jgi:hypothetical protein
MAIGTGAALFEYGTQFTVISDTVAIANGAFNGATITALVQTDYAPLGDAVLTITMAVAPSAGAVINLYRRDMNITSTNDSTVPDANYKSTYVGSFLLDLVTSIQYVSLTNIPLTVDQEFYIENESGQATTTSTTIVQITPKTYNAKV